MRRINDSINTFRAAAAEKDARFRFSDSGVSSQVGTGEIRSEREPGRDVGRGTSARESLRDVGRISVRESERDEGRIISVRESVRDEGREPQVASMGAERREDVVAEERERDAIVGVKADRGNDMLDDRVGDSGGVHVAEVDAEDELDVDVAWRLAGMRGVLGYDKSPSMCSGVSGVI